MLTPASRVLTVIPPLILIPKNGLGNRLRAIAGGLATARALGRELEVLWEPYDGSATKPEDLFDAPSGFRFVTPEDAARRGVISRDIPKYVSSENGIVSLRGYDRGQQVLLPQFLELARTNPHKEAVIAAGNYFHPDAHSNQEIERLTVPDRQELSRNLPFNQNVTSRALQSRPPGDYLAVHLRSSDRRKEVPSPARVLSTAVSVAKRSNLIDIFVCSDTEETRAHATNFLQEKGLHVFFEPQSPARRDVEGEINAGADFVNLQHARIVVGSQLSTFATEAAILLPSRRVRLLVRRSTGLPGLDRLLRRRFGDTSRIW